jgi:hypothetical protein
MHAHEYTKQLQHMKRDLFTIMSEWSDDATRADATKCAEKIAPLAEGEIQSLGNASFRPHERDTIQLRNELESMLALMSKADERKRFTEYVVMLESLINEE